MKPGVSLAVILLLSFALNSPASAHLIDVQHQKEMLQLVSTASDGTQGDGISWWSAVSADGKVVAFSSEASNLVDGDTNGLRDVFVRDRLSGKTARISVSSDGQQAFGESGFPDISADGRYVVYHSFASNLVEYDNNGVADIFLYDRATRETFLISTATGGMLGDGDSRYPSISADGHHVAFQSYATNLVEADNNGVEDIFVHNIATGETTRVSLASDGSEANQWSDQASISPDGFYIAFRSYASNLVSPDNNNYCDTDQDGFFDDNCQDIFLHDSNTGETSLVSVATDGTQGNNWSGWPVVSANGRYVAFQSWAEDLVQGDNNGTMDVFIHDSLTGETSRGSIASDGMPADCQSEFPTISSNGRYIAFSSCASNLVDGDTNKHFDIFLFDRFTHQTHCLSLAAGGAEADGDSSRAFLSVDGRFITFDSDATNLVPADRNGFRDSFIMDRGIISTVYLPLLVH